ncbi:YdaU family protein [Variovorax paradoxus]|uniref:YdaU family protein n=1 Tax=Variovorax paradoxus TaxID=34073 RepID=UPI0019326D7A|nr:YdaU family protein [Variovorax paradoxus]
MNYYEHHLGDFLKKTAHLSAMQEGIYRRLLDRYYITEQPLPGDFEACCRLARANGRHEKQAVREVLAEFFSLVQGFHANARADEEIAKFQNKSKKAKASANARWEKEKAEALANSGHANASETHDADDMRTHSEGNAPRARPQTPDTSNQSPDITAHAVIAGANAGAAAKAMRAAGLQDANPSHPELLALLAAGITLPELEDAARVAAAGGKGFVYALRVAAGRRREAAKVGTLPAAAPPTETPYQRRSRETVAAFAPSLARRPPGQRHDPETIEAETRDVTPPALG